MKKLGKKFISFDVLHHAEGENWKELKEKAYDVGYNDVDESYINNDKGWLTIWVGKSEREVSFLPSSVHDLAEALIDSKARRKFYEKAKDCLFYHYNMGGQDAEQNTKEYNSYADTVWFEYNSSRGV